MKLLREEITIFAMNTYIENTLGTLYISPVTSPMEEIFQGTDFKTPFVFILSTGADPMGTIERFALEKQKKLQSISLGQG